MSESSTTTPRFDELGLDPKVERVLKDVGYETPSPIQAEAIPPLLAGQHVVGLAQTGNRWVFPEQLTGQGGDLEPWGGVRAVWAAGSPGAAHAVDTTDTFDLGVASLKAHRAYIDGLGWENWDPAEFLEGFGRTSGQRLGVAFAAPFEVFPMGWGG